jgi:WD40 repeat protein
VVKLWDLATEQVRARLEGHLGWVRSVAFSADGRTLASGARMIDPGVPKGVLGEVRLWDAVSGRARGTPLSVGYPVSTVALSARGGILAAAGDGPGQGEITLWDLVP